MACIRIDGKAVAEATCTELKDWVLKLERERGIRPGLAVVLVGGDPASAVYVKSKEERATSLGFVSKVLRLPDNISESKLLSAIHDLNRDAAVHGILVQLPLPPPLRAARITAAVDPAKDVDGFHPENVGALCNGLAGMVPCTPRGIMKLLTHYQIPVAGQHAVVIGRSNVVGKPMAQLLLRADATVTMCHSKTTGLIEHVMRADIVIAAMGRPQVVNGAWLKKGATVIDVGIHRLENGKLCGDVDYESAERVAGALTPVPGGVGPMTIAMLMLATCEAAMAMKPLKQVPR